MKLKLSALIVAIVVCASLSAQAQKKKKYYPKPKSSKYVKKPNQKAVKSAPSWLNEGTTLVYEITSAGKTYNYTVHVRSINNGYNFDFEMAAPINNNGTVIVSKWAADSAMTLDNYFNTGINKMEVESALFLSRAMMEIISIKGQAPIMVDGIADNWRFSPENLMATPTYKGKNLPIAQICLEGTMSNRLICVLENNNFPLITAMKGDVNIKLIEIK
ncbi:MAG: hypothetical protein SGJ04_00585 [Bacteroidota bacterium]|nr:hypothetical protein [Bacteroidota bacterium]